jgi:hypothetical protein
MKIFVNKNVTMIKKALLFIPIYLMALGPCQGVFSEDALNDSNIVRSIEYK